MTHNSKRTRLNIPMCVACILFCLTLISIYFTSGLYAKYTGRADVSHSARVARFGDITLTEIGDFQTDGTMMIIPGVDLTKKAYIDFAGSEASTYIFTEITLSPEWLPTDNNTDFAIKNGEKVQMEWHLDTSWTFLSSENNVYVYYLELSPNTALTGKNIIADGRIAVSEQITKKEIADMTDISIQFRAAAVQNDGMKSPDEVWKSISAKGR